MLNIRYQKHDHELSVSETHVRKAPQIIHLRKNWPVPIHTGKNNEKSWSIKWHCYIAWRPTSTGSDGPRHKRRLWCEGSPVENPLLPAITFKGLSSLVTQMLSAGKVKMSREEASRCYSKTAVLWDNQRRRLSINTAKPLSTHKVMGWWCAVMCYLCNHHPADTTLHVIYTAQMYNTA